MRALGLLVLLAACGPAVAPEPVPVYRAVDAPIGSTLRGSAADLNGEWLVAAAYPGGPVAAGDRVALQFDGSDSGVARITTQGAAKLTPVSIIAPGRWQVSGETWWLLWTDDDFRTAVIGQPDGRIGWIMDRPGAASVDRSRAARQMLEFYGYDTGALATAREN